MVLRCVDGVDGAPNIPRVTFSILFCPEVRAKFHVWVDEDGELCWRKRDFLWVVPRLLSWSRRATVIIEAEYAPGGPKGRQIIQEWCCAIE